MENTIVKIVTQYGFFTVGHEKVTVIERHPDNENYYIVYRDEDKFNRGTKIEIKCDNVLVYWEEN
jgi:hypothetical protein